MFKVLLIEDDKRLCEITKEYFNEHGLNTIIIEDFSAIPTICEKYQPDLIVLDINLPNYDGFYLCKLIRKKSRVPIIFISARDGIMEQVMGMEVGADDYVVKPYRLEILYAKVTALLRRTYGDFGLEENKIQKIGTLVLDGKKFKISCGSNEIELSKNEYILLKKLIDQKDNVINRNQLLIEIWDDVEFVDDNTLTVNITRLKNKLLELNLKEVIKTKRGIGYWLDSKVLVDETIEN